MTAMMDDPSFFVLMDGAWCESECESCRREEHDSWFHVTTV